MEAEQYTVNAITEGIYKEKGSKFIAYLGPARTREEADAFIAQLWKKYHDARHICFAYRIGNESRVNDDGEPAHSAGSPILRVLQSAQLENVVLGVIRYFGGIKLGVPGLIRAYSTAAEEAVTVANLIPHFEYLQYKIEIDYQQTQHFKYFQRQFEFEILTQDFSDKCRFTFQIKKQQAEDCVLALQGALGVELFVVA